MQPQYPTQQPAYAQPPTPQYPQQYAAPSYPPPGYAPAYPQQQYAAPAPLPAPPLPTGTLDSFYEQPSSGGGPSFKFMDANRQPQIGKSYAGIVARPVTNADVRAQTDQSGRPMTYKDGRPKFVLVVPILVQPCQEFPEGVAGWWVKGQARDELARAMAEAGAPAGPPEAGAGIRITLVGVRPVPGMSPAYQYRIDYMRPTGAVPGAAPQPVMAHPPVQAPPPVQQYAPVQQLIQTPPPGTPVQAPVAVQQPVQQPVPAAVGAPAGFSPEQAELFARLTGQPAG